MVFEVLTLSLWPAKREHSALRQKRLLHYAETWSQKRPLGGCIARGVSDSPEYISYRRRGAKGSLSSSEKSFREIHWKGPT